MSQEIHDTATSIHVALVCTLHTVAKGLAVCQGRGDHCDI